MSAVKVRFTVAGAFLAGAVLVGCVAAACVPDDTDQPAVVVDPAPPIVNEDPAFPSVTLTPCVMEDSDNCYWDAARMGNGTGTSFIRLDGVTYRAEVDQ
jgi:hypothetical protein